MPTVTEQQVPGYISCRDPRCPGYEQKPAEVTRRVQSFDRLELGGDMPGPDHESIDVVQPDAACEYCGGPVIFADTERPEYAQISGQDQLALLHLNQQGQIREQQVEGLKRDKELAEMRAQMAEMQAELQRRRGGRPPKTDDE